jgi:predicted MFS family arabinose efflux permease
MGTTPCSLGFAGPGHSSGVALACRPGPNALFWIVTAAWGFAANGAGATVLVYNQNLFPEQAALASGLTMGMGNTIGAFGAWAVGLLVSASNLRAELLARAFSFVVALAPVTALKDRPTVPSTSPQQERERQRR